MDHSISPLEYSMSPSSPISPLSSESSEDDDEDIQDKAEDQVSNNSPSPPKNNLGDSAIPKVKKGNIIPDILRVFNPFKISIRGKTVEAIKRRPPSQFNNFERELIREASQTVKPRFLQKFLQLNRHESFHLIRRNKDRGRPRFVSDDGLKRVREEVSRHKEEKNCLTREQVYEILTREANNYADLREVPRPTSIQYLIAKNGS